MLNNFEKQYLQCQRVYIGRKEPVIGSNFVPPIKDQFKTICVVALHLQNFFLSKKIYVRVLDLTTNIEIGEVETVFF